MFPLNDAPIPLRLRWRLALAGASRARRIIWRSLPVLRGGPRWLRWCGTLWLVGTLTATLGFGYHYGVDLVAGGVLCLTVESALREPERGWAWWRIRLVAGGAMLLATMLLCFRYLAQLMEQLPLVFGPLVLGALAVYVVAFYATFFGQPRGAAALRDRVAMYGAELQGNRPQPDALYD